MAFISFPARTKCTVTRDAGAKLSADSALSAGISVAVTISGRAAQLVSVRVFGKNFISFNTSAQAEVESAAAADDAEECSTATRAAFSAAIIP